MVQLFIGGVRSGKSDAAEDLLLELTKNNALKPAYIATSIAFGEETIERIKLHQQNRELRFGQPITTHELNYQTLDLLSVLKSLDKPDNIVLIECLSTWVGWYLSLKNTLQENLAIMAEQQTALLAFLKDAKCHVIIVTGEVGCGLIGETPLQRRYADQLGKLNQKVAAISEQVYLLTAGLKQQLK
ncbi:bifunctional adenosylcobinamide kinase/adenosylcobinamide-phosphate guanylyltransferase [Pseudoalteromonas sp. KJ10-2]|uniref:bifunctional adenosylcobinamide kinase/adenosylcobinamide-phosphate guanylyltransferase n=1 Tax=Psychromonas sp. KJ10-2 TaxID=3391822 RepID=UPI0039B370E3